MKSWHKRQKTTFFMPTQCLPRECMPKFWHEPPKNFMPRTFGMNFGMSSCPFWHERLGMKFWHEGGIQTLIQFYRVKPHKCWTHSSPLWNNSSPFNSQYPIQYNTSTQTIWNEEVYDGIVRIISKVMIVIFFLKITTFCENTTNIPFFADDDTPPTVESIHISPTKRINFSRQSYWCYSETCFLSINREMLS